MKNATRKIALCAFVALPILSACEHVLSPEIPDWLAQLIEKIDGDGMILI